MTEREREEELFKRAENRENLKKRFEIKKKLKQQQKHKEEKKQVLPFRLTVWLYFFNKS
jgi:hypothetical protein